MLLDPEGDQEKSSSGKKFESAEKSNFFPLELFSSKFFWVHMEAIGLQKWQTTHFKAYSKWWRMDYLNLTNSFDKVQKNFSELSFWN